MSKILDEIDNVIMLNPGTATLKWAWFSSAQNCQPERVGSVSMKELDQLLNWFKETLKTTLAVVRFVHGGNDFFTPVEATPPVLDKLKKLNALAPLHNPNSLICIKKTLQTLQPVKGVFAVFDTEYFQNLPIEARSYALPKYLIKKHGIRRFGFHGFAHQAMFNQWKQASLNEAKSHSRIITVQLGSGCSMAAVKNGSPIDTSMGFTPNEGLMMATRSGDIDAGLLSWLQKRESWTQIKLDHVLNQQSGWFGVSGESADMRKLLRSTSQDAALAIDLFVYRIRKTLGAYYAILGGLDAIIFSGGVAENATSLCHQSLSNLEHFGIRLSTEVSNKELPVQLTINSSKVSCQIVKNNEFSSMLGSLKQSLSSLNENNKGQKNVSGC